MTLAQLLPQAKFLIVTTPQPAAQSVARRGAEMAAKFDLEILGVVENMSGFTTPDGERFTIFGEGGGQLLADELDVPLLGKVPLSEPLREHSDVGTPAGHGRARLARLAGDPPGGARHRRRDAAGAAGAAGGSRRGRGAAGQRHAAAGRPVAARRPHRNSASANVCIFANAHKRLIPGKQVRGAGDPCFRGEPT